jgi:hypothetical protein
MLAEQFLDGPEDGVEAVLAGGLDADDSAPFGGGGEAGQGALGEGGLPFVDGRRRTEQGDAAVAEVGEVVHAALAGADEVQVDTGQFVGVGRDADQDRRHREFAQDRDAFVVQLDVHHHQRVDQRALRDPFEPVAALVGGEQQDVVVEPPGGGDDGGRELHDHRDVHTGAQRDHQGEHVRSLAGQGSRAGIGPVAENAYAFLHPVPRVRGDGPLAAEDVGHRAGRHARMTGHIGDGHHRCLLTGSKRFDR